MPAPVNFDAPPPGPAWNHPPSRQALERYRRRSWFPVVFGVGLLLVSATTSAWIAHRSAALKRTGTHAAGTVVDVFGRKPGRISLEFQESGVTRRAPINLTEFSPTYDASGEVTLIAAPWRVRYFLSASGKVWVAEDPTGKNLVLTSNGGADLFRARRP
jgi:hypothetical protein